MRHPPDRTPDEAGDPDSSAASSSPAPRGSDAADDLLATAEDLAERIELQDHGQELFLTGTFSVIDALTDSPME